MSIVTLSWRSPLRSLLRFRSRPRVRKPWTHTFARLGVLGFYLYWTVVVVLIGLEDSLLFNPRTAARTWEAPPDGLDAKDVTINSRDGTRLHGWWCEPQGWEPEYGAMLYCHGNACNLSIHGDSALVWQRQLNVAVLLIDYPGYGHSDGTPSEAGLYAAGDAAYAWLIEEKKVPANRLLIHGLSLGGGVAIDLAARRPHRALILSGTFTSFPEEAQAVVPFTPAKWLAHNQFRNIEKISHVTTPVFIAHSTTDPLIPFSQGERLYAAVISPHKRFLPLVDAPHDLRDEWDVHTAVRQFLLEVDPLEDGYFGHPRRLTFRDSVRSDISRPCRIETLVEAKEGR